MRLPIAILGTVAALLLSPAVEFVRAEETEEQAVAAIEKLGGTIGRDEDKPGKPVVVADLQNTKITDAGLAHLKGLKTLAWLSLNGTKVGDAGLVHLKDLKQLEGLNLNDTKVGDAGLVKLRGLKNLEYLSLGGPNVSDVGLAQLKRMKRLRDLDLSKTKVTDAGVKALQKALPKLKIAREPD